MKRYRILDGTALKLIALTSMLIDHTASILLRNSDFVVLRLGGRVLDLYTLMRCVGRISFPIYAFLLVEGFLHTSSVKRYARDLLILALVSELPWNLSHAGTLLLAHQNVMFTMLFGLLGMWALRDLQTHRVIQAGALFALLGLSLFGHVDYGAAGYGFIIVLYLLRSDRLRQAVAGSCVLYADWLAAFGFVPIALYNGKRGWIRGRAMKYVFYAMYPAHLLILYLIRSATIGY